MARKKPSTVLFAIAFAGMVPLVAALTLSMVGVAAVPSWLGLSYALDLSATWPIVARAAFIGLLVVPAYFVFTMLAMAGGALLALPFRGGMRKGTGKVYGGRTFAWGCYGLVMGIVHLLLLPRMSPLARIWITLMGGKCGKRLLAPNPVGFSDLCLLDIGDDVTIGSGAVIAGHTLRRGILQLVPVVIGDGATIGTNAVLLGGATVGEAAVVAPNSVLPPGTVVGPGETWAGVPAICVRRKKGAEFAA